MKKLQLEVEALEVETFEMADRRVAGRGTVQGAANATLLLSQCNSGCMQSGIQNCLATQTCC